ncbi:hypothetical protein M408DRAFT_9134 [Serendipita vermifera MAFF 305830]|uniref:Uncharacterized protein n=1 Tax=Serendipita vermifera MAFF 305830 TaxID=933852 RepID=A0A0C3B901_SERVB|nr:hypothetical protein M408DRAFT_9134 [Serendipita vermifera MAFF 305830]
MSHNAHYASFQFSYDTVAPLSSQLSSRHYTGSNPREFLKSAGLPSLPLCKTTPAMPAPGRKAHKNHLQSYYDPARGLTSILRLRQTLFHLGVIEYCEAVPTEPARGAPPTTGNPHPTSNAVAGLSDVSDWVYTYGLLQSQQTLHQTDPSTQNYQWISTDSRDERDLDRKLMRMYHWNTLDKVQVDGAWESPAPTMIAFVQEPWVLGERDFSNFTRTRSMPQAPRQLTGKERLWAKIYDECTRANCRWFVVTTYYQWTFGVFSEGFQAAFITLDVPSPRPYVPYITPLQALHYWLASAMQLPETYVPTQMMETAHYPELINRTQQYRGRTRTGEWQLAPVFQHSDSEPSSESDEEFKPAYSRCSHRPESEVSFQSSTNTLSPTAENFRNTYLSSAHGGGARAAKLPIAGDQLTKETLLPRRHWRSDEKAERLEMARAQLKINRARNETLDWLEEREWDNWEDGGAYGAPISSSVDGITSTMRATTLRDAWVTTTNGEPPSPTMSSVSRDGSMVGGKRGPVGKAMFAVAPKHPRRAFAYQA